MTCFDNTPLSVEAFEQLLTSAVTVEHPPRVVVATSGGADSMALCLLSHRWAKNNGGKCYGLIVDHGLRSGSDQEAGLVADWLTSLGIEAHVLEWEGPKPKTGIQAAAREARYSLIQSWCAKRNVRDVLLAHHRDDQGETFLMRLGRRSGIDGLSAMAAVSHRSGIRLVRPLLDVPKTRLISTLRELGHLWIEDPANRDPAYTRTKLRQAMPSLADIGITAEGLALTARRMARARKALDYYSNELIRSAVDLHSSGYCWINRDMLLSAPEEIGLRVLSRVIGAVGAGTTTPRYKRLERLFVDIVNNVSGNGRTLAGCRIITRSDRILVCREIRGIGDRVALKPGQYRRWDARFDVRLQGAFTAHLAEFFEVRRLGQEGWRTVVTHLKETANENIQIMPPAVRTTLPALWDQKGLVDVPHLSFHRNGPKLELDVHFTPCRPLEIPPF
jgi:tRNA(Ile)-lysidine synthase